MKKYQNGSLQLSKFGTHNNVKTISLLFSNDQISFDSNEVGSMIFENKVQLSLHKRYFSIINPNKQEEKVKTKQKKSKKTEGKNQQAK
jgi:hypothetical protein